MQRRKAPKLMGRAKKDAKILNIKLDRSIYDRFENYANQLGQTKTTAIERILTKHLDEFDCKKEMQYKLTRNSVER